MVDQLYAAITATGVGGFVAWLVSSHQRRLDKRDEEERRKALESLEKIRADELKSISASINKVSDKIDRIAEITAAQASDIRALDKYTSNLDNSLEKHKLHAHGGKV